MNGETTTVGPKGRLAVGILLILLGIVLSLDQAGVLHIEGLGRWWPLYLIGAGVIKIRQPLEDGQRANGTALVIVGALLQLVAVLTWGAAWPLLFALLGTFLVWKAFVPEEAPPALAASDRELVSELALLGAVKKGLRMPSFRGGYITAVMGGVELDLRKCTIVGSPAFLDVVVVWGGVELKVPAEWAVEERVLPIMGGVESKIQPLVTSSDAPRLIIRGYAIMGGVSLGN